VVRPPWESRSFANGSSSPTVPAVSTHNYREVPHQHQPALD
jgi:hypothetical protein